MFTNNHTVDSTQSVNTYNIFIFQPEGTPDEGFYHSSFNEKINILREKIIAVKEYLKTQLSSSKNIFVAPEYIFKICANKGANRYYSQDEKNIFKQTLIDLSLDTDLILAPGTICWKKTGKDEQVYFRNIIYFVHKGNVKKYKKHNPHTSDFDYWDDYMKNGIPIKGVKYLYRTGSDTNQYSFWDAKPDNNLIEINDLIIGIEICSDHGERQLAKKITETTKIDIHLIVAAGLSEITPLRKNAQLTIKVDAYHYRNAWPKTISLKNNDVSQDSIKTYGNPIESTGEMIDIVTNVKCHRFKL